MSVQKQLMRREILARRESLVGTVVSDLTLSAFDASGSGAQTWVADVDIGQNRVLRNVLVKGGTRGRFFAQRGQTVALRRNAQGRFDVVGPADRVMGAQVLKTYDVNAALEVSSSGRGFAVVTPPFEYYLGARALKGNPALTFAAGPDTITRAAGSWLDDGFEAGGGDSIRIGGSSLNDATRVTTAATALVLTCASGLVDEGPVSGVGVGVVGTGRWNDGATPFPISLIVDQATGLPV